MNRRSVLHLTLAAALVAAGCAQQQPRSQSEPPREPPPNGAPAARPAVPPTASPSTPATPPAAETPPSTSSASAPVTDRGPLTPLAWLEGCWQGSVNQRDFTEQWLPLRGGMLIGAGQSVLRGKMDDYQYLRVEAKPDAIYFTQFSGDRRQTSFKLVSTTTDDKDTIFTFANTSDAFPARLIYRRGAGGWLFETIEGPLNGAEKRVIYPLRRSDCETGALIPD